MIERSGLLSEQIHTYQHVHHILVDLLYREFAREIHFR